MSKKEDIENVSPEERLKMAQEKEVPAELEPEEYLKPHARAYKRASEEREAAGETVQLVEPFEASDHYPPTIKHAANIIEAGRQLYAKHLAQKQNNTLDSANQKEEERIKKIRRDEKDFIKGK